MKLSDFSDESEVLPSTSKDTLKDEEESMMRFAKFLEKNGFIRKMGNEEEETSLEKKSEENKWNKPGKTVKSKESLLGSDSELTIYRNAVEMEMINSDNDNLPNSDEDKGKRSSSSLDELNSSGETAAVQVIQQVRKEVNVAMKPNVLAEKDEVLYHQFVDCRLKETTKEGRQAT